MIAVDRQLWQELLVVLDEALEGSRRPLARMAEREGVAPDEALRDLAALPARACAAVEKGSILRAAACRAGAGCPVEDECPLVRGGGRDAIQRSGPAHLVRVLVQRWTRPLPPAPFAGMPEFARMVDRLVQHSGRVGPNSPPRARTANAVLDLALRRGGPFAATGPFLTGPELEQVAAFVPPGSARGDALLVPPEAWLRRAVSAEVAVIDPRP